MLEEIKFNTRGEGLRDFTWFACKGVDLQWKNKYKSVFSNPEGKTNLFAEIENGNYRIFFDKIDRPWTITRGGTLTPPYIDLVAAGKCGSESAKAFYKMMVVCFLGNKQDVENLFAEIIPKDYIEEVFDNARTLEVEKQIAEKLGNIVSKLPEISVPETKMLKDNKFIFDKFEKNKNAFFSELKRITVPSDATESLSLVLTINDISEESLQEFDCKPFTSGLCLTTGSIDGGKPIVKTIRESKPTTQPIESVKVDKKAEKDNSFFTEGTTSIQKAQVTEHETEDFVSKISKMISNPSCRKLLIVASIIILALLLAVRSCVNRSGSNSEKSSPESKEQPSSPTLPDSLKKFKDTLTTKVKTDTCKTPTDTLTM